MPRSLAAIAAVLVLAACGRDPAQASGAATPAATPAPAPAASPPAQVTTPDLAACAAMPPVEGTEVERKGPLPVPAAITALVAADRTHLAVSTLAGGTTCIDTSWMEDAQAMALSPDRRFLSFEWLGYETGGFVLVDRSGKGQSVETGARPVPSPSGRRLAAVEYSESGFGTLNGFALWEVRPQGLREAARLGFPEGLTEWRLDGWQGEDCLRLSAIRFENLPQDDAEEGKGKRDAWAVRRTGAGWALAAAPAGAAACAAR
jgi:hypothetical protein